LATPSGLPIAAALTGAKADERDTCLDMIAHSGPARPGQTLIADKGYRSAAFEEQLNAQGITLWGSPAPRDCQTLPCQAASEVQLDSGQ